MTRPREGSLTDAQRTIAVRRVGGRLMPAKLTKLTPAQQADLRQWWQKWYEAGVSTAPADRSRAEAAVSQMYQALGRQPPRFLWVPSPATGILAQALLSGAETAKQSSLGLSLRSSLSSSLGSSLHSSVASYWWGQHESYWVAFYTFGPRIGVLYAPDKAEQLDWWAELAESCGWWAAYENIAIMCDRPEICTMEETGQFAGGMPTHRLHSDKGPALRYRDGWSIYSWHGVQVPQKLIEEPDSITREDLLGVQNAEVRRSYMERLGAGRFAQLLDLAEVDRGTVGHGVYAKEYALWRTREPDPVAEEHIQFVNVLCHSTEREYMLCVPPEFSDVYSALAWTFNQTKETYRPEVEA